jgi:nucleotide-binding universal stress UspA family protein
MPQQKPMVIAVVTDDDRTDTAIQRASDYAREQGAWVLLYDVSATGSVFESPLPTQWSSEDLDRSIPPGLNAQELDAAGQARLAARVRALNDGGVDAFGWLPDDDKAATLATYADANGAAVVVVVDGVAPSADDLEAAGVKVERAGGSS